MSANYNRKFVNNKQAVVSPKVESDINVLTALEVSEFLKPTALKTERGLDERALSLLQEVLPVVAEDGEKYRRKAEELAYRRANTMGVRADRLLGEGESFDLKEDDDAPARQRGFTGITSGFDNMLDTYIRMTDTCAETIRKALHTQRMSLFDIERIPRYLSMLSQSVVREGLDTDTNSRTSSAEAYSLAAQAVDSLYGGKEPYVVSRRLLDKYSVQDTLEELDGWIKTNAVTSKKKDLPLFEDVETTVDPDTGIRILTAKGKLDFRVLMSSVTIERGMALTPKAAGLEQGKPENGSYINVAMTPEDTSRLTQAITKLASEVRQPNMGNNTQSPAERFAEAISSAVGFRRPFRQETSEEQRNRLLGNLDKIIYRGYRGPDSGAAEGMVKQGLERFAEILSFDNMKNAAEAQDELSELMERHIAHAMLKEIYQNAKSGIISNGVRISYESDKTMEKDSRTEFPFIDDAGKDVNPFAAVHPGKLATLCTEMDLALLRLNALPIEMAGPETGTGGKLAERISELKARCIKVSSTTRRELEEFLGQDAEEAAEKMEKAISDASLRVDDSGWFMDGKNGIAIKDSRKILGKALKETCISIRNPEDHSDAILTAAMEYMKADSGVSAPSRTKEVEGQGQVPDRMPCIDPETGDCLIEPPRTYGDSTPATRFALIAGMPVNSDIDAAVPPEQTAYYADPDGSETSANTLLNKYGDLNPDSEKNDGVSPEMLYNDVRSFVQACVSARTALGMEGPDPAEKYLAQAEIQAKVLYVAEWKTKFSAMKDAWALCYQDTDSDRNTLVETYSKAGKEYGEALIRALAADILKEAGLGEDAERLAATPDDMGEAARYTCRHLAIAAIDSTIDKIVRDMTYAEGMNSRNTDWNRWQDYKKEDSRYDALMKSTVPVFTDDLILSSFLKRSRHPEELMKAAQLMSDTRQGQEAVGRFADLIKAEDAAADVTEKAAESIYDPDTNSRNARTLCLAVCTAPVNPDARKEALDALAAMEANNPDEAETYGHLRDLISGPDFKYGTEQYRECLDIVSEGSLEHLSPGAKLNPHLPKAVLREKDLIWAAKRRAEMFAETSDIKADSVIPAETRARIDSAIVASFSPETSGVRYLSRYGTLTDMSGTSLEKAIEESVASLTEKSCEDLEKSLLAAYGKIAELSSSRAGADAKVTAADGGIPSSCLVNSAPKVTGDFGVETKCPRVYRDRQAEQPETATNTAVSERRPILDLRNPVLPKTLDEKRCSLEASRLKNSYSGIDGAYAETEGWKELFKNSKAQDTFKQTMSTVKKHFEKTYGSKRNKTDMNRQLVEKVKELDSGDPVTRGKARKELAQAFRGMN